jgi:hypothetical protein
MKIMVKKKVLIVSCRFDEDRYGAARPWRVPQAMAPAFLSAGFNAALCEIRLYSELYSGPLNDKELLSWPDMLVLSGLQVDFDRFLHLTAYARTLNPKVIVVAGGSLIEVLPKFSSRFFDYCCPGPVEEIREVIRNAFGKSYVAETHNPRHELAYWNKGLAYVESSRYCNFHCNFCTMSIKARPYEIYDADYIRRQILLTGRKRIFFLDNNFFGNDVHKFERKLETLREMKERGELHAWGAELTADFFLKERNLKMAKAAGCRALFCGVESFDQKSLISFDKRQNVAADQVDLIRRCLDSGILFLYGLMPDPTRRTLSSIRNEFEFILNHDEIPLPSYITLPIPLLGTPLFFQYLSNGEILPGTRIRDLDGTTLSLRPLEPLEAFSAFWPDLLRWSGCKSEMLSRTRRFLRRYREKIDGFEKFVSIGNVATLMLPKYRNKRRTFISSTECLDPQYEPAFRVSSRYESYFKAVVLVDKTGNLNPQLEELSPQIRLAALPQVLLSSAGQNF